MKEKTKYYFAPGTEPQWNIPKIMDTLVELYNREHGTNITVVCTKKSENVTAPDSCNARHGQEVFFETRTPSL